MAATNLYIRKSGSAANGGSSTGASPDRTGSDGVTAGTTTFVAASGGFSSGDVDKLINIVGKGRYRITAFTNSTTVTLSGSPSVGSTLTWNLGGACLNIGDLLEAAASTIVNGDAIWIGAGVYRETISCTNTNTAEVTVNGDVNGVKTGDVGMVQLTAYLTDDKTAASSTTLINLNSHNFLTFKGILFIGGNAITVTGGSNSTNIQFVDCCLFGTRNTALMNGSATFGTQLNWTFDRCILCNFTGNTTMFIVTVATAASGAHYDVNVVFKNCLTLSGSSSFVAVQGSGSGGSKGNGVHIRNCTFIGSGALLNTNGNNISSTVPSEIYNCVSLNGSAGILVANASGGLINEDYNLFVTSGTVRSNVSAGAHSISDLSYAPLIHITQERVWGALLRQYAEPLSSSPLLGFGNDGNQTAYDLRNNPRPAGGASALPAVGALGRANTFTRETGTTHTGSNAISITGPGYQDFLIPVNASSTTLNLYVRWDSTYSGTKPQIKVLHGNECGVADATATATGSADTWEQLSLNFTPTAKGIVTLRVSSNDTNGGGKCFADSFSVS